MSYEKNKYITAYGSSNADSYGRGDVTDVSTKYNMLTTNPLSDENAPEINSYSSDGSYNQDIFGWKCFNSPVSFRNGIYGECGAIVSCEYIYADYNGKIPEEFIDKKSGFKIFNYDGVEIVCGKAHANADSVSIDCNSIRMASSIGESESSIYVTAAVSDPSGYYSRIILNSQDINLQVEDNTYMSVKSSYIGVDKYGVIEFSQVSSGSDMYPIRWAIGRDSRKLDRLYVNSIICNEPTRVSDDDALPFNTIAVLLIKSDTAIKRGDQFTYFDNVNFFFAALDNNSIENANLSHLQGKKLIVLSGSNNAVSIGGSNYYKCLVMVVEST